MTPRERSPRCQAWSCQSAGQPPVYHLGGKDSVGSCIIAYAAKNFYAGLLKNCRNLLAIIDNGEGGSPAPVGDNSPYAASRHGGPVSAAGPRPSAAARKKYGPQVFAGNALFRIAKRGKSWYTVEENHANQHTSATNGKGTRYVSEIMEAAAVQPAGGSPDALVPAAGDGAGGGRGFRHAGRHAASGLCPEAGGAAGAQGPGRRTPGREGPGYGGSGPAGQLPGGRL